MANQYDLSDLGGVRINNLSDLSAIPVNDSQKMNEVSPAQHPFYERLKIPYNLAVGAGGGIQNFGHDILPGIIPKFKPHGLAQNIGDTIGNIGTYLVGPEAALAKSASYVEKSLPTVGRAVESLGKLLGEGSTELFKRLGSNALYGAITEPKDRLKGAETGLATAGIGEGIGALLGKGLPKVAEFLYPKKFTNELANSIKENYQLSKGVAGYLYKSVLDKVGDKNIVSSPFSNRYINLNKDVLEGYTPNIRELHNEFINNPTLNNAHKLQSDMGREIAQLSEGENKSFSTIKAIQRLTKGQKALKNDIASYLANTNTHLLNRYKEGSNYYKNEIVPYFNNKTITNIASGDVETINPKTLQNSLRKLSELKQGKKNDEYLLHQDHYLRDALENLSHKIERGEAAATTGALGGGAVLGNMLFPGGIGALLGSATGAGVGALGSTYIAPKLLNLATNRYLHKSLPKLKVPYDLLVKSIINTQTGNS